MCIILHTIIAAIGRIIEIVMLKVALESKSGGKRPAILTVFSSSI
jgi:hypothetical protein